MKENLPNTIYKFRDWTDSNHKKILTDNEIFMSFPNSFNDPFDCRIPVNHHLLNTESKINKYVDFLFNKHKKAISQAEFQKTKNQFLDRLKDIDSYQKIHEETEFESLNDYLGVLSLSGRWDSILMWGHYANLHKGFCIGLDESKMRNSGLFHQGGLVNYTNDFPQIDPLDFNRTIFQKSYMQTHYKAIDWEYEMEYRFINIYYPTPIKFQNRAIRIKNDFFREIILGLKISKSDKTEIIEIAKNKEIPVFQVEKIPFQFKMKKSQIA